MEQTTNAVDLSQIQLEQTEWSLKNFGIQPPHRPLLGIIEELGELEEAWLDDNKEEVADAIGDVAVYMLDYCGKRKWSFKELWDERAQAGYQAEVDISTGDINVVPFIKRLSHSQLKGEQGIRGGQVKHDAILRATLSSVLWMLNECADIYLDKNLPDILAEVWAKVSKRDWVANPSTAHEVAAIAEPKT